MVESCGYVACFPGSPGSGLHLPRGAAPALWPNRPSSGACSRSPRFPRTAGIRFCSGSEAEANARSVGSLSHIVLTSPRTRSCSDLFVAQSSKGNQPSVGLSALISKQARKGGSKANARKAPRRQPLPGPPKAPMSAVVAPSPAAQSSRLSAVAGLPASIAGESAASPQAVDCRW